MFFHGVFIIQVMGVTMQIYKYIYIYICVYVGTARKKPSAISLAFGDGSKNSHGDFGDGSDWAYCSDKANDQRYYQ